MLKKKRENFVKLSVNNKGEVSIETAWGEAAPELGKVLRALTTGVFNKDLVKALNKFGSVVSEPEVAEKLSGFLAPPSPPPEKPKSSRPVISASQVTRKLSNSIPGVER